MGLKQELGRLNTVFWPLSADIRHANLIHDDLIVKNPNEQEDDESIGTAMQSVEEASINLNPKKFMYGKQKIHLWELMV